MRWPWLKSRSEEKPIGPVLEDLSKTAAIFCMTSNKHMLIALVGEERFDKLTLHDHITTMIETMCCFLHFIDRKLSQSAPQIRQMRMDNIIIECRKLLETFLSDHGVTEGQVNEIAHDYFLTTYSSRMEEFSNYGNEWLEKMPSRYCRYLAQRLGEDAESTYKFMMLGQMQVVEHFKAIVGFMPALFKP